MNSAKKLQWEKYGKIWVGLEGEHVVCAVARAEEAPLEMFTIQFFELAFTTLDAAKAEAERSLDNTPRQSPFAQTLIPVLKNMLATLEGLTAPAPSESGT
jgi:hypothetical protein